MGFSAQPSPDLAIVLTKRVVLTVRVDDPAQLLATNEATRPGAHLSIGVTSDANLFHPETIASRDSSGRTYPILIPDDRAVRLSDRIRKP